MPKIGPRLTYANVMATVAVFLALGGGAYAAFHLPADSVKSGNIVNGQVKQSDLAKSQQPKSAGLTDTASNGGCSNPGDHWENWRTTGPVQPLRAGYYRDPYGRVFLQGTIINCEGTTNLDTIFTLPPGYRPANILWESLTQPGNSSETFPVGIDPASGHIGPLGVLAGRIVTLDGISFRCGPSGQNGCP